MNRDPAPAERRGGRPWWGIPDWLLLGLAIRLLLVPFSHPWDLQTWYNVFVDLAHNHSPYETMRYLTYSTRSEWGLLPLEIDRLFPVSKALYYEYYAYPPLPLAIYYPLAKLYALFAPLHYQFVVQGALAAHRVPLLFLVFFKAPIFAAGVCVALVLRRLAGERQARTFFLNPLVILVSAAWTIEDIMTAFVVLALFLLLRKRDGLAGFALALGTLTKWWPGVLWPAAALWLLHQRAPARRQAAFHGVFLLTLAGGIIPFWDGIRFVAQFQALRPGQNLTPHVLLYLLAQFHHLDAGWYDYVLSPYVGAITLPLVLGAAYLVQVRRSLPLPTAAALTVVAFFLGSKIVNEQYIVLLLPLLLWEEAERPSPVKTFLFRAFYALPLTNAMLNVPFIAFALPAYLQFGRPDLSAAYGLGRAFPLRLHAAVLTLLAFAFVGLLCNAWRVLTLEGGDETVPDPARRSDPDRARLELPPYPVG